MKKILFLIHDLGSGGAEKVLVNLVNNMDPEKFNITVTALFGGGVNEQFLKPHIRYISCYKKEFRGNSHYMKLFSPETLHKRFIKEDYDIEVSYLEGPSARVISGCRNKNTKLVSWIHVEQHTEEVFAQAFRSMNEARECYNRFDKTVCVSDYVKNDFCGILDFKKPCCVLYNTNETDDILRMSSEPADEILQDGSVNLIAVGTLRENKGYTRLLEIIKRLNGDDLKVRLYILGKGPQRSAIEKMISENNLQNSVTLLGYQTNPYKYVSKCDLFVCSSYSEGFSTAATEALIVGTPVCTTEVSGMKEMLGNDNEYGIVTDNNEDALYEGVKSLVSNPDLLEHYRQKALERGKNFNTAETVKAVEDMLLNL